MRDKTTAFNFINLQNWILEDHSMTLRNNVKLGENVQVSYRNMNFKKTEDAVLV